jgi:hypothetical protein
MSAFGGKADMGFCTVPLTQARRAPTSVVLPRVKMQQQYAAALCANYDHRCSAVGEHLDRFATEYNR